MKAADVEAIALKLANGATVLFPQAAPFVEVLTWLLQQADEEGIIPHELTAEQAQAIAAGMAAARASAVTSFKAKHTTP